MTPRDIVLEQIHHRQTFPIPFTLEFEGAVDLRLDEYYGGKQWRKRLTPYIINQAVVDTIREKQINDIHTRDAFGGLWRHDQRPFHLEQPAMNEPSFENYTFPNADVFLDAEQKKSAMKASHPNFFISSIIKYLCLLITVIDYKGQ